MDWERFLFSVPTGVGFVLGLAGLAVLLAGTGYRRIGAALATIFAATVAAAAVAWLPGVLLGLSLGGRGEGAGLAALLLGFALSGLAMALVLIGGMVWLYRMRSVLRMRGPRSLPVLGVGGVLLLLAAGALAQRFIYVMPSAKSDEALVRDLLSSPNGPLREEGRQELLARGQAAVPDIIAALHQADTANLHEFENGLNGGVLWKIEVLGQIGGSDAIAELRTWLESDYAPDLRAAAAQALATAGNLESAPSIALLLEEQTYEWKKCRVQLLYSLGALKARDALPQVRAALQFAPEEEGRSYQLQQLDAGIQALVSFDTPEAWQVIQEVASAGGPERKAHVARTLEALGKALP